jgi:hypothetical protein
MQMYKFIIVLAATFFIQKSYSQHHASLSAATTLRQWMFSDSIKIHSDALVILQKDHYVKNLAFMCRQEWKIEKKLKIPLRLRMGSVVQCDYLEGK